MEKRFTYSIKTMGCKANVYDSLVIERELSELGGIREENTPDLFVLNSCTVTAEADRQCQWELNQVAKQSAARVAGGGAATWTVLTGCYAEVAGLGVPKPRLKRAVAERFGIATGAAEPDPEIYWGQLPSVAGRTRAFLKIQEGCNDFCTYCIIPYARGKSRSVRLGPILAEIERLAGVGLREVVLTGTNIADYGKEWGASLEDLVEAILEKTTIPRLRLSSLDPTEITERLLRLMPRNGEERRLTPHFHVSLQSPVSRVLRAMKRHYRKEEVADALARIHGHNPDLYVGMDVIAGFPSETPDEHAEAVETLSGLPWTRLHVFPYSERKGTPAVRIPGKADGSERKRRARELMALSHGRHEAFAHRFVGSTVAGVLFEGWHEAGGDFYAMGHAPNYMRVMARVPSRMQTEAERTHNTLGSVRVVGLSPKPAQDWTLEGVLVSADARDLSSAVSAS